MRRTHLSIVLAVVGVACAAPTPAEIEESPLTLTVAGDVTIDSINPAYGIVAILDPTGRRIATTTLVDGRYRVGQLLDEGVNVCEGFAVFTEIADERGSRVQSRALESTSGECVVSSMVEIVHYVDLDFPILLGRSGAPGGS
ncbi:MAG: hypothetical protein AAF389_06180 [Gemmatimonadota bacterium]